jgi:hypothetical protein
MAALFLNDFCVTRPYQEPRITVLTVQRWYTYLAMCSLLPGLSENSV